QMDQVIQQNAAQTEELSSTAQSLANEAELLRELVDRFHLEDTAPRESLAPRAPAPIAPPSPRTFKPKRPRIPLKSLEPVAVGTTPRNGSHDASDDDFQEF